MTIVGSAGKRLDVKITSDNVWGIDEFLATKFMERFDPTTRDPSAIRAEIKRFYESHGYVDTTVGLPSSTIQGDTQTYDFPVTPERKYYLQSIVFEGNHAL